MAKYPINIYLVENKMFLLRENCVSSEGDFRKTEDDNDCTKCNTSSMHL